MSQRNFVLMVVGLVLVASLSTLVLSRRDSIVTLNSVVGSDNAKVVDRQDKELSGHAKTSEAIKKDGKWLLSGSSPLIDSSQSTLETDKQADVPIKIENKLPSAGRPVPVPVGANAYTKSLGEDLKDPDKAAATAGIFSTDEKFDPVEYAKAPQDYLNKIRPARAYESLPPGDGVTPLKAESKLLNQVIQGESVLIRASGNPSAPITFHTNQIASFSNQLKTISTTFNENGIATATLKTGPGSENLITVLAASPLHSSQLKYVVRVLRPN